MKINANTKIAAIIKQHPDALETIISINPKFEKLRNPFLRKLMAGRTSISMASKIAGCQPKDFFEKLATLGFEIDHDTLAESEQKNELPKTILHTKKEDIIELDVRPILASGADPLNLIIEKTNELKKGEILKIINTFEPTPLIKLLEKRGFKSFVENISANEIITYFFIESNESSQVILNDNQSLQDWDTVYTKFETALIVIDVRMLEMPQPMMMILENLEQINESNALFVHHKKVPLFLLPELSDKGFEFRIKGIEENYVQMLIYKAK